MNVDSAERAAAMDSAYVLNVYLITVSGIVCVRNASQKIVLEIATVLIAVLKLVFLIVSAEDVKNQIVMETAFVRSAWMNIQMKHTLDVMIGDTA